MARKVASELLLASHEEHAEIEVKRAAAERQTSHLSHRLRLEEAAHSQLQNEYADLQQTCVAHQQATAVELAKVVALKAENEALMESLLSERERIQSLEATIDELREERRSLRERLSQAEAVQVVDTADHLKGLAEHAIDAEAARGRELAARLEQALRESREREEAANQRAEAAAQAMSAEGERRARQLRLQLEQLRDAAEARDREATEALRSQKAAERLARASVQAEEGLRQRVGELQAQLEQLRGVTGERDALSTKAEQLGRLAEAQVCEGGVWGGGGMGWGGVGRVEGQPPGQRSGPASADDIPPNPLSPPLLA
jgi:hypothetical protein